MSSNHDQDNHPHEAKPVAFGTPLILALVTVLILLVAVSTCDKKHGCCEDKEKCETKCEPKHEEHATTEAHGAEHAEEAHETVPHETSIVADTLVEEHAHH